MNLIGVCFLWPLIASVFSITQIPVTTTNRTFVIDYEKNEFLKDGEVFRYVSGSIHYFRIPRQYWKDRIQKMKAAGLNAISTYVEWKLHEPSPGVYNFEGIADFEYFMKLIKDENMYLILRPGPYICAERDFGGFPYWLLNVTPHKSLRTNNSIYKKYVSKWFSVLLPKVQPYLYGNGGNIIMVQVENEYGSYFACDLEYKVWLRDLYRSYIGNNAVLFTVDVCGQSYFDCGTIPEVYATVDFGIYVNATECFDLMRRTQKGGPLVNSELYIGWLTHWQEPLSIINSNVVVDQMKVLLALNASFNFYMFHGGTNFGFTSGANTNDTKNTLGYLPQLTSYDFNAPLDEAGDPTDKYFKIQNTLRSVDYLVTNDISPVPAPKGAYGIFRLRPLVSLFEKVTHRIEPVFNDDPLSFEVMDINTGFVMYETTITSDQNNIGKLVNLTLNIVRDRAIIYLDQVQLGTMSRLKGNTTLIFYIKNPVHKLSILIENQGRINYGDFLEDRKGIERVFLENQILSHWTMTAYPLNETSWLSSLVPKENVKLPAFYRTQFTLPQNYTKCLDTYLDPSGWTKGVAFLNDFNLGRYWPVGGPQVTLYVPATILKPYPNVNTLIMLELEQVPDDLSIKFVDTPILNGPFTA